MKFKIKGAKKDEDVVCELSLQQVVDGSVDIMVDGFSLGRLEHGQLFLSRGLWKCKGITTGRNGEIKVVNSFGGKLNG